METFEHSAIEKKWQQTWKEEGTYKTLLTSEKPKKYILDMFPYPSGAGLHVGHPRGYVATDVYSRFSRMNGFEVLHPMGWDAFGLPAENFAIKNQTHPKTQTDKNIENYRHQLDLIGMDYDWNHEVNTTDPAFYKWTQWMFLKMYKEGLAYESHEPINWCSGCQTGLANEDVEPDGTCERCGTEVQQKPMRQWVLKITDYADRLIADLDTLPKWPEYIKEAQRNWIGKSEGAMIAFETSADESVKVFTTRPDTLFGATYAAIAPEHDFLQVHKDKIANWDEVQDYISKAAQKDEIERTNVTKEKTGIEVKGITIVNPANKESIPLYVADYVLAHYGTGVVMAVPAHDERDFAFAKKYDLPIRQVVAREFGEEKDNEKFRKIVALLPFCSREQKYAMAKWSDNRLTFLGGGVDQGEDIYQAAVRELREEAGLDISAEETQEVSTIYSHYYHDVKNLNRFACTTMLCGEVDSMSVVETQKETHEDFSIAWMSAEEIQEFWLKDENISHDAELYLLRQGVSHLVENAKDVVSNPEIFKAQPFTENGLLINSGQFDGKDAFESKKAITEFVGGEWTSTYRLKDWVFSRQRYWGEPIPMIHAGDTVYPADDSQLPVLLPEVESYAPSGTGESPLANIDFWVNVKGYLTDENTFIVLSEGETAPEGKEILEGKRETNTMPQWAGSSWYYLRYLQPQNDAAFIDKDIEEKWLPVDVYVGGDHATRHLIYARFWHKVLLDLGLVTDLEPFPRLEFLGFILAEDGTKMSKSKGNTVAPDDVIAQVGADAFRTFEMFIAPFENATPWSTDGLAGTRRFLEKVWRQKEKLAEGSIESIQKLLHQTIKKVSEDIENFKFNTAVSALMILTNEMDKSDSVGKNDFSILLRLLAPFAPHVSEELWREVLGNSHSIHQSIWPEYDESLTVESSKEIAVQINGKVRSTITVNIDDSEEKVIAVAKENENIARWIEGKEIVRIIYIQGKILNVVIKD